MSDSGKRKYRGTGYGWQTDKEFESSRRMSDAARPGCYGMLFWLFIIGLVGSLFNGDLFDLFGQLDDWGDFVAIFIVVPFVLFWLYSESKK